MERVAPYTGVVSVLVPGGSHKVLRPTLDARRLQGLVTSEYEFGTVPATAATAVDLSRHLSREPLDNGTVGRLRYFLTKH